MKKKIGFAALVATMLAAPMLAQAGDTIDVGVGTAKVKLATNRPLKLAFFSEGTNNSAMTASIEGAKKAAAALVLEHRCFRREL